MSMLCLYRGASTFLGLFIRFYLERRKAKGKEDPGRFQERLGIASTDRPEGKLLWLHAASVGEAISSLSLIKAILSDYPEMTILQTTGTVTSANLMAKMLPVGVIHQYIPVDRLKWVRSFLNHWRPDVCMWLESELWPNLICEIGKRQVPLILVNGRMSDKSFHKWQKYPKFIKALLSHFHLVMGQSKIDAERFKQLGAEDVISPGNMKMAAEALDFEEENFDELSENSKGRKIWLAASTHPGEEVKLAETHALLKVKYPNLLTIIVPRHPHRGEEIELQLEGLGLSVTRRVLAEGNQIPHETDVYLADTMGELGLFFRLTDITYIGGTMDVGAGGHNPVEPAQLDCAIIHGPDMKNFRLFAENLSKVDGGIMVAHQQELADKLDKLFMDKTLLKQQKEASSKFANEGTVVLDTIMKAIKPFMTDTN